MAPEDREKTAFSTHRGLFQFTVMPFGLCNAPGTFERLMEVAMRGLQWTSCLVYLDDIVVFSRDFEGHLQRLGEVLGRLESAGLKVKPSKCRLARGEVAFLGHVVNSEALVRIREGGVRAGVANPSIPDGGAEFLGSGRILPVLRAGICYHSKAPIVPGGKRPHLQVDLGLRVSLPALEGAAHTVTRSWGTHRRRDGSLWIPTRPTWGWGQSCPRSRGAEKWSCPSLAARSRRPNAITALPGKELLAVMFGLKKFRHYLLGRHVKIRTDHAALKWVMTFREPEGQVARWLQVLDTYDYDVEHRPGRLHGNADGLSRAPCRQCGLSDGPGQGEPESCRVITRSQSRRPPEVADEVRADWVADQKADELIGKAYRWVEEGIEPGAGDLGGAGYSLKALAAQRGRLEIKQGLLGRWWFIPGGVSTFQVLVPESRREEVWASVHGGGVTGHLGRTRTIRRCQERFYWPEFRRDLTFRVATCPRCLERKPPPHPHRAAMGHVPVGMAMERVAIDVMGPLPLTPRKNRFVVVMVDYFTKWAEAIPTANQEAATVAKVLVETMVCRFGAPGNLHSDQGRNFQSRLFKEVTQLLEMKQTWTCAFNPKSDGMVERCNRTIEALLSAVVAADHSDWDEHLPFVMAAYRSSVHSTIGVSPNAMMLGRETTAPLALLYPEGEAVGEGAPGYVAKLKKQIAQAHDFARKEIGTSVARQTRNHDKRAENRDIPLGSVVYYYHPLKKSGLTPKFQRYWTGPWKVLTKIGAAVYEIQRDRKKKIVHYDSLKVVPTEREGDAGMARPRDQVRVIMTCPKGPGQTLIAAWRKTGGVGRGGAGWGGLVHMGGSLDPHPACPTHWGGSLDPYPACNRTLGWFTRPPGAGGGGGPRGEKGGAGILRWYLEGTEGLPAGTSGERGTPSGEPYSRRSPQVLTEKGITMASADGVCHP